MINTNCVHIALLRQRGIHGECVLIWRGSAHKRADSIACQHMNRTQNARERVNVHAAFILLFDPPLPFELLTKFSIGFASLPFRGVIRMKILAGIDGTERSYHALEFASGLLSPKIDDIHLYYSPPKIMLRSTPDVSADLVDLARDALAKSVFEIATNRLPSAFQSLVGTTTGTSKAYEGVLSAAEKERADLVVIGSHRTRRSFPLLLGGNARKIAHHSTLPVLMVRSRQAEPTVGMRVLIACDEHEAWRPAAEFLKAFSWPEATNATLFNVVEMLTDEEVDQLAENSVGVPDSDKLIAEYRASSEKQKASRLKHLAETHASLPSIVRDATPKIGEGHVVEAIVREVLESDIDLVVVGARKLSALGRLFGSTTEGLLAHCPCSLLIVHEFEKP